jgi:DNA-binding MarR family transcriptional regulator
MNECERLLKARDCTNTRMRRAARAVSDFYNVIMEPAGLHANQFTLLIPAYLAQDLTISQLAQLAGLDRTTLARNLKVLEERGLIRLRPGDDQRTRVIGITDLGRQTLLEALPLWEKAQQQISDYLGQTQLAGLLGYVDLLETLLPPQRPEPSEEENRG